MCAGAIDPAYQCIDKACIRLSATSHKVFNEMLSTTTLQEFGRHFEGVVNISSLSTVEEQLADQVLVRHARWA